jgi:RNA polymerase sigma-70 factor, ECF subfamily
MTNAPDPWAAWLDRHGAALVLFARQWVVGRADAEDVVQEAFIHFWRSRQRAKDPMAYLYGCVRNCAFDFLRSRKRQARRDEASARQEAVPLFVEPLEQDERRAAIETALHQLPETQREVLVMKVWGELSFLQIAEALGVSINTAASRYRYALAKLRQQLAKEPIP